MSEQTALFGISVPPEVKLTERQWFALETVANLRPNSAKLGLELHRRRGCSYCKGEQACQYASGEGAQMGNRLRELGLVRFSRKKDHWYLAVPTAVPAPDPDDIPY
jgi:hypothetical protein